MTRPISQRPVAPKPRNSLMGAFSALLRAVDESSPSGKSGHRPQSRWTAVVGNLYQFLKRLQPLTRQVICGAALTPIFMAAYFSAFWVRFDGQLTSAHQRQIVTTIGLAILVKVIVFAALRAFQGWSRHATFHDLTVVIQAATVGSAMLAAVDYSIAWSPSIPRGVLLIDWTLTIVAIGGLRSLSRLVKEGPLFPLFSSANAPVFIVGANDAGEALLRAIRRSPNLKYHVVGFITAEPATVGSRMAGVPVRGILKDVRRLAHQHAVQEVLITAGELPGLQIRKLVDDCQKCEVQVKVVPCYEQLLQGKVTIQPRAVSIEDLLRRAPVKLDQTKLRRWIDDRVLLVTGSSGSIGSEICRQLLQFAPRKLVLVDRSENGQFFLERELREFAPSAQVEVCIADVTDGLRMSQVFREHCPQIVFHAAAYKHVPLMEAHPGEAVKNICLATRLVADLASQYKSDSFVMVSTDKAVNPTNVMGSCKRVAELYVQSLAQNSPCQFVTVRFGNVLDSAGSVVPIFREQIAHGGPVTVTHPEMARYFMTIPEASRLVIQAGAMGRGGEIFVLDMGEPIRIIDLAKDMIRLSGLREGDDIEIRFTGLRPGEKLCEELYGTAERTQPTSHPKIMVATGKKKKLTTIVAEMTQLVSLSDASPDEILSFLKTILPEYSPAPVAKKPSPAAAA